MADSSQSKAATDAFNTKSLPTVQELEDFLRKFLYEMALEATDGHTKIEHLDYVSEEHLYGWATSLAEMVNKVNGTFTVHGQRYELASYSEPFSDGSRKATIRLTQRLPQTSEQTKVSENAKES